MRRVKIAAVIVLAMVASMTYLTYRMQRMGRHMTGLSQEIIAQASTGQPPEQITASLAALEQQWAKYELLAITLAGRNHADSVTMSLKKAMIYPISQEDEDLIASLTELVCNVHSMCITERVLPENFT